MIEKLFPVYKAIGKESVKQIGYVILCYIIVTIIAIVSQGSWQSFILGLALLMASIINASFRLIRLTVLFPKLAVVVNESEPDPVREAAIRREAELDLGDEAIWVRKL